MCGTEKENGMDADIIILYRLKGILFQLEGIQRLGRILRGTTVNSLASPSLREIPLLTLNLKLLENFANILKINSGFCHSILTENLIKGNDAQETTCGKK